MIRLGRRQIDTAMNMMGSAAGFGGVGFLGLLYISDWRVFVDYIPFYNSKFPPAEEDAPK